MTVRDLVQQIILNAPDMDATVYVNLYKDENDIEPNDYEIISISDELSSDGLFIRINQIY